jgi:hypothetical protein
MATSYLQQLRRALGRALDDLAVYPVASSAIGSVTSSALADETTSASANRFDGAYVFACGTRNQRRVQPGGFTPATGALDLEVSASAPAVGSEIEITRLLPCAAQVPGEDRSYEDCVNRAVAKILVPDRVQVAITTAETYALTTYPWLSYPERLLRVLEPGVTGTRAVDASWRGWRLVWSGGYPTLELETPFDTVTGSLTLEVLRPADTWNGAEKAPGIGMLAEADSCIAGVEEVIPIALMEALYSLMSRNPGRPGQWDARYAEAKARAEAIYHFDGQYYKPKSMAPPGVAA